jgi:hypothetical protein
VIFLKEKDVILTNAWRVTIDLSTGMYEEAVSTIKGDLLS